MKILIGLALTGAAQSTSLALDGTAEVASA